MLFQNKCMEDLGCFYTGPPFFDSILRPKSCLPMNDPKTLFKLFTRSNRDQGQEIEATAKSLENSYFHPELPVKVLIHGYRTTLGQDDIRFRMKDVLLETAPYNVIVVDWTKHNQYFYEQAVANTRAVGMALSKLIEFIMDYTSLKAQDFHLIGHSLGAHVAGYAGKRIPDLGRITGLDPAGPYFRGTDRAVHLDSSDALFVDIIHTDAGDSMMQGLGDPEAIGHVDFYPNGGSDQPGCERAFKFKIPYGKEVKVSIDGPLNTCDHSRSCELFLESIDSSDCKFMGSLCASYDDFKSGKCNSTNTVRSEMGFHATRAPNSAAAGSKYYLRTNGKSPFCIPDEEEPSQ